MVNCTMKDIIRKTNLMVFIKAGTIKVNLENNVNTEMTKEMGHVKVGIKTVS